MAQRLADDGYGFPIDVLDGEEALSCRREYESLEERAIGKKQGNKDQLNYPHVIFRFAYQIACHPKILDAVEAILGPDILVWGSSFFVKESHTAISVSSRGRTKICPAML